jgi:hypothetical protein
MKRNKYPEGQNSRTPSPELLTSTAELNRLAIDSPPQADEVANKAYFSYLNQGSLPGHDVQHWLQAEAELLAERNVTRVHGFHHQA